MNQADSEYFKLAELVLSKGRIKNNRTKFKTIGVFGAQARFDLQEGFPLLTTKKVFFKGIVHELLWFIKGDTNIKYLVDNNVHIWDEWAYAKYLKSPVQGLIYSDVNLTKTKYHTPTVGMFDHLTQAEFIEKIKNDNGFAKKWGELGEGTYGGMWRKFPVESEGVYKLGKSEKDIDFSGLSYAHSDHPKLVVDQLQKVIDKLKNSPDDRRIIVSAWHPYWVDHCALPPCHVLFQFHTEELTLEEREDLLFKLTGNSYDRYNSVGDLLLEEICNKYNIPTRRLNCQLYQRSCDLFLGVPFNIASYSLLTCMLAQVSNMVAGEFIHTYGDLHIYENHVDQIKLQMSREPKKLPTLKLNPNIDNLFNFKFEDINIENYDPHPAIKGEVAV
jgi:thymidylate synthase